MRSFLSATALFLAACQAGDLDAGDKAEVASNAAAGPGVNEIAAANGAGPPAGSPDGPVSSDEPAPAPQPNSPGPDCPIVRSSDWRAHVDAMPGPNDNPRLIVSGKVTVPTGGYRVALRMGRSPKAIRSRSPSILTRRRHREWRPRRW